MSNDPTVPPPRPMGERSAQAQLVDRLCNLLLELLKELRAGLPELRKISGIAKDLEIVRGDLAQYLPSQHLAVVEAAKASKRTEDDTAAFRKVQLERDVGKLHLVAQVLESLRKMDLHAKVFVVVVLTLLIFGAHFLYPILHPGAVK